MQWASRRGLLELDLLLAPFVEECYRELPDADKADFKALVAEQDQDIMQWLMGHAEVPNPALKPIIEKIRAHNASKLAS